MPDKNIPRERKYRKFILSAINPLYKRTKYISKLIYNIIYKILYKIYNINIMRNILQIYCKILPDKHSYSICE